MICPKCKDEHNTQIALCKNCGIELDSTCLPLSAGERISIIVYFLILLATSFPIGAGAIPLFVSFIMLYIIKTNKNFNSLDISYKIIIINCILVAIVWVFCAANNSLSSTSYRVNSDTQTITNLMGIISAISLCLILVSKVLFFSILERHKNWVIYNGLFTNQTTSQTANQTTPIQLNIIGKDDTGTFSIADEMLKWNELLEKGLISKEEFDQAKQKLLQQQK